jgi:hypothetical protein
MGQEDGASLSKILPDSAVTQRPPAVDDNGQKRLYQNCFSLPEQDSLGF